MTSEILMPTKSYEAQREIVSQFKLPIVLAHAQIEVGNYGVYDFIWDRVGAVNDLQGMYIGADYSTHEYADRRYVGCDETGNIVVARMQPWAPLQEPKGYKVTSFGLNDSRIHEWRVTDAEIGKSGNSLDTILYLQSESRENEIPIQTDSIHSGNPVRDYLDQLQLEHLRVQSKYEQPRLMWSRQPKSHNGVQANAWFCADGIHLEPMIGLLELTSGIHNLRYKLGRLAAKESTNIQSASK